MKCLGHNNQHHVKKKAVINRSGSLGKGAREKPPHKENQKLNLPQKN